MEILELLEQVKNQKIDIKEAEDILKKLPYEDIGCAKIDHHRALRSGFGEVIFCSGKTTQHLIEIYKTFDKNGIDVLGTRASQQQYESVCQVLPEIQYDPISRILKLERKPVKKIGLIAVCTGGTADIPVAEEAAQTAEFFGANVERYYDVGVAGIHRLFANIDGIKKANSIVAVAGMEGALGGVIAGMVENPVISVPTSIGYGANFGGVSALLTMLNSCAEGLAVVNIDNGFGAGYMAVQINRLAVKDYER